MNLLVTGGYGFIGSHFIDQIINNEKINQVINIDSLTYAANKGLKFNNKNKYVFYEMDINSDKLSVIFNIHKISHVVHFAAESHVDNSIRDSSPFIKTNINGTHNLLQLSLNSKTIQKFIHVSTDEVFGSLGKTEKSFDINTPYKPNSPYASSKASSDLIARSFYKTYGLPVVITNCSNNFGPRQHKEKLIPKAISSLKNKKPIPLYGDGSNIRDWIFVKDHVSAIEKILFSSEAGKQYLIGGDNEISNFDLIHIIATEYENISGKDIDWAFFEYVEDRKGHDLRYSIDTKEFKNDFPNWKASKFNESIKQTISYYI